MAETFDFGIIGAGIVGLAVGREILSRRPNCRLLILEKEKAVACHQTGHNSGVIHSGIYYKPGSLKARFCAAGSVAMLNFVKSYGLPYEQCGKVIVATEPTEIPALEELWRRGEANGVPGLRMLPDASAIREIEPHAWGIRGIHVPSTAITDFKKVAEQYAKLVEDLGGTLHLNVPVTHIIRKRDQTILLSEAGEWRIHYLINCAGLQSDRVAHMSGAARETTILPFRGEYHELRPEKNHLVRGLIYPVPDPDFPFLGVHLTRRVTGCVEAGPNAVLALKREGYKKTSFSWQDSASMLASSRFWKMSSRYWRAGLAELHRSWSKDAFTRSLQRLLPELQKEDLLPGGAGIRAQAVDDDGKLVDDFRFVHTNGATHVCNVPSPAATASLQIAAVIVDVVLKRFNSINGSA